MVWNVTKNGIKERMAVSPDQAWSVPGPKKPPAPIGGVPDPLSDYIKAGKWPIDDVQGEMVEEFKKEHGLKYAIIQPPIWYIPLKFNEIIELRDE